MARNPADYGTAEEAKVMLKRAVAALKEDKTKALAMFNKGEGGFKDRDLYVYCANASDGIMTAHPTLLGKQLRDIKGKHGAPRRTMTAPACLKMSGGGNCLRASGTNRRCHAGPKRDCKLAVRGEGYA
jgi:hypothetical protein